MPSFFTPLRFYSVIAFHVSFFEICQFALNHPLAKKRDVFDKNDAFQMVVFVLDDACDEAGIGFVFRLQVFVEVLNANFVMARHFFVNARNAQATFFHRFDSAVSFHDVRVDEYFFEIFVLRILFVGKRC